MKKNQIIGAFCATCFATLLLSTNAMAAATGTITDTTGTIPDGNQPGIAVKLSPGVHLAYNLDPAVGGVGGGTSFAINTMNVNVKMDADGATTDRNEYGIANDYPGYYMRMAATQAIAAPAQNDSSAFPTAAGVWTAQ